jgi:hypothetical protein
MSFVSEAHPDARFCVTAYSDEANEAAQEGVTSYYTTLNEARSEFERVSKGQGYYSIYLGRWINDNEGWEDLDEWPEQNT